jgi:hypothetical protein
MGDDGFVGEVIPSDRQNESQLRPECNNYFQLFPTNRFVPLRTEQPLLKITKSRVQLGGGVPLPALAAQLNGSRQLFSAVLAHDNGERIKGRVDCFRRTHAMR